MPPATESVPEKKSPALTVKLPAPVAGLVPRLTCAQTRHVSVKMTSRLARDRGRISNGVASRTPPPVSDLSSVRVEAASVGADGPATGNRLGAEVQAREGSEDEQETLKTGSEHAAAYWQKSYARTHRGIDQNYVK